MSLCLVPIQIVLQKDLYCLQDIFLVKGPVTNFIAHNQPSLTELSTATSASGVDVLKAFLVRALFPIAQTFKV